MFKRGNKHMLLTIAFIVWIISSIAFPIICRHRAQIAEYQQAPGEENTSETVWCSDDFVDWFMYAVQENPGLTLRTGVVMYLDEYFLEHNSGQLESEA